MRRILCCCSFVILAGFAVYGCYRLCEDLSLCRKVVHRPIAAIPIPDVVTETEVDIDQVQRFLALFQLIGSVQVQSAEWDASQVGERAKLNIFVIEDEKLVLQVVWINGLQVEAVHQGKSKMRRVPKSHIY